MARYVANISYGKDSLAMLYVILEVLHWPLDEIATADCWATQTIRADLPPMVEFADKADQIIKERWGFDVVHYYSKHKGEKETFEDYFYRLPTRGKFMDDIHGWPTLTGTWCNRALKLDGLKEAERGQKGAIKYIGIAIDEPIRVERHIKDPTKKLPLVEAGWTEPMCRQWCEENDLLSPIYAMSSRGGCWFCPKQKTESLRRLRKDYPDLWEIMLRWDSDSPKSHAFRADKRTLHDLETRFAWEDDGYRPSGKVFKWEDVKYAQMNIDQFLKG